MPVCMGRACCLCVRGVCWWGREACRVTRQRRAWPGPGPLTPVGGGHWAGCNPPRWAPGGGGGGSVLPLPALHWHNAGTSRRFGGLLLCRGSRREAHRWDTPAVVYTHSAPQAYGVMG